MCVSDVNLISGALLVLLEGMHCNILLQHQSKGRIKGRPCMQRTCGEETYLISKNEVNTEG